MEMIDFERKHGVAILRGLTVTVNSQTYALDILSELKIGKTIEEVREQLRSQPQVMAFWSSLYVLAELEVQQKRSQYGAMRAAIYLRLRNEKENKGKSEPYMKMEVDSNDELFQLELSVNRADYTKKMIGIARDACSDQFVGLTTMLKNLQEQENAVRRIA